MTWDDLTGAQQTYVVSVLQITKPRRYHYAVVDDEIQPALFIQQVVVNACVWPRVS